MRLAYLYSRYPVVSQTFCDMEMLELERRGFDLVIGSVHPPLTSLRHEHLRRLKAPIHYAPPHRSRFGREKREGQWTLAASAHRGTREKIWPAFKAAPACAQRHSILPIFLSAKEIDHFHVHFANRAAHTALFLKH